MVRIKVFKLSQLIYYAVILIVAVALLGLIVSALTGGEKTVATKPPAVTQTVAPEEGVTLPTAEVREGASSSRSGQVDRPTAQTAAAVAAQPQEENVGILRKIAAWLLSVDMADPVSLLSYHLPVSEVQVLPVTAEDQSADGGENEIPDESDVGEHIRVEISRIDEPYVPPAKGKILIYHTHTYEAYEQDPNDQYVEASAQWRTKDESHSIVGVGNKLARELTAMGYEVVHDKTEFEPPKLGTSYIRSLEMLDGRVANGEEYAMIIDLHRDAWDQVQQRQMTATVDGEEAARLMMLIGTGEGSTGAGFSIKPNWKENYKLADALTRQLNGEYPGLAREVMVKTGRYNQHISDHSVLIEVGNNRNTLKEALAAMGPLARAIDQALGGASAE